MNKSLRMCAAVALGLVVALATLSAVGASEAHGLAGKQQVRAEALVMTATASESESESAQKTPVASKTAPQSRSLTPKASPSFSASYSFGADETIKRDAVAVLTAANQGSGISGTVEISCASRADCDAGRVTVTYDFATSGVNDGDYSLNFYEFGSLEDTIGEDGEGKTTGRYFLTGPPVRQCTPSSPQAGDLGNINVANGVSSGSFSKSNVFLTGDKSVIGRGIAVEEDPCVTTSDGKDTEKLGVGVVGIAQPPAGVRSVASSGAAPSSVERGVCVVQGAGANGVVSLTVASKTADNLRVEATITTETAGDYALELFTYGDLSNTTEASSLGGVNSVRFGADGALAGSGQDQDGKFVYKAAFNATGLSIVGAASVVGKGMAVLSLVGGKTVVHGTCAVGLTGQVADLVCETPTAANFNQKAPCILAAKLMPFGVPSELKVPGGPTFSVGAKSLKDDVFVEVFEVIEDLGKPNLGAGFSDTKLLSTFEFEPAGTEFVSGEEPVVKFQVAVEKGYDPYAIISNDGVSWEQLLNVKYENGELSGQVAHFSFISAAAAKKSKKDDDDDDAVALGVGLGVGLGGGLLVGAAAYVYYQKNKSDSGSGDSGSATSHPLTPQEKYGNI